jgi:hypothetical protein
MVDLNVGRAGKQWLQPDFPSILLVIVDVELAVSLRIGKLLVYMILSRLELAVGCHQCCLQIYTVLAGVKRLVSSCFVLNAKANSGDIIQGLVFCCMMGCPLSCLNHSHQFF